MTLKKLFILLLLSNTWLFGCALCNLKRPIVHVNTEVSTKNDLVNLHITWEMAKDFSIEVVRSFDINGNEIYEEQELYELQKILELYLIPHHYLTFIKTSQNNKTIDIDFKVTNASVRYDYGKSLLYYSYDISLQKKQLKNSFGIKFYDSQKYFDLLLYDFNSDIFNTNNLQRTTNSLTLFFDNNSTELFSETMETKIKKNIIVEALSNHLNNLKELIKANLTSIKDTHSIASYFWLILFSLLYGLIHAAGPGHGKTLVSAYFINGKHNSYTKALSVSVLIGIVHTFSAFFLTLTIYFVLNNVLFQNYGQIELIATKISAIIIISIGIYLLQKKINQELLKKPKKMFFSTTPPPQANHQSSCGCGSCNTQSTDFGVILSAGIVPCPGTVTIFIFTISLKMYLVGFLSALFMSLGMSSIIFISALASIKLKQHTVNAKLIKTFEYGSLLVIILLGVVLFFTE